MISLSSRLDGPFAPLCSLIPRLLLAGLLLLSGAAGAFSMNLLWLAITLMAVRLIFAMAGKQHSIMNDAMFSVIVMILTTLVAPPMLTALAGRRVY